MTFTPEEMRIFEYHDGYSSRYADPLELLGAIERLTVEVGPEKMVLLGKGDTQTGLELIVKLRPIFGLSPVGKDAEGKPCGTPAAMVLKIFSEFMDWTDTAKNPTDPEPIATSPSPTEQAFSDQSFTATMSALC
jgi:hypothetical protein